MFRRIFSEKDARNPARPHFFFRHRADANDKHFDPNSGSPSSLSEGAEKAKAAVQFPAGFKAENVSDFEIERKNRKGAFVYEIGIPAAFFRFFRTKQNFFEKMWYNEKNM